MALTWRDGVFLLEFAPGGVRASEFEEEKVAGELRLGSGGKGDYPWSGVELKEGYLLADAASVD